MNSNLDADAGTTSSGGVLPAELKQVPRKLSRRSRFESVFFTAPAFLFQLTWGWYPLTIAFFITLTNAPLFGKPQFVGLQNYQRVWNDPLVADAFKVTLIYAALSILLTFVIPIIVAIFLMEMPRRHLKWMMTLWFLPLSGIASAVLWRYFYDRDIGILQQLLTALGLPQQQLLFDPNLVLFWLILPGFLLFGPGLIYMATLQSIPQSYYEAAEVEGAHFWRKIWTISLPRLRPIISMMLTFAIIGSLQTFEWPLLMTNGGPGGASRTVVIYIYDKLRTLNYADATTISVYLFALIMMLVLAYNLFFKADPDK